MAKAKEKIAQLRNTKEKKAKISNKEIETIKDEAIKEFVQNFNFNCLFTSEAESQLFTKIVPIVSVILLLLTLIFVIKN